MKRAYSLLTIKSIDEDLRIIEGVASTPEPDRLGDIVEPEGASYELPLPLLWQHNSREPIGHVIAAKVSKDGITIKAQVAKIAEPCALKERLDDAWRTLKAGLVRGLSIGFNPLESARIKDTWSQHFLKWDWLELSCVTIAANQDASITSVKSADQALLAASGRKQRDVVRLGFTPGASGQQSTLPKGANVKQTIAEQISAFEKKRAASVARMDDIMAKAGETGSTLDETQTQEYDTLKAEVKAVDEHLVRLKEHEASMVAKAPRIDPTRVDDPGRASQVRSNDIVVLGPRLPKGVGYARYVKALAMAKGNLTGALAIAQNNKNWRDQTPDVELMLKAAVAAGDTTTVGWASELVYPQNLVGEFIEFLRPQTIIGRIPGLTPVPFNIRVAGANQGSSAFWVGQGKPVPVSRMGTFAVTLGMAKAAGLVVLDQELVRASAPSAELMVRNDLGKAIAQFTDVQFISPDVAAVANVSPASITNGVNPTPPTGATGATLRTDVQTLFNVWIAQNLDPSGGVWIMTPGQALAISLMLNALGQPLFSGPMNTINMNGGLFFGMPVVTSQSAIMVGSPVAGEGNMIILLNAPEIMLADDGGVSIDASTEASLEMLDNPTNSSTPTVTATSMVSMFQTSSVALKAIRFINWAKRRSIAVQYIKDAAYVS